MSNASNGHLDGVANGSSSQRDRLESTGVTNGHKATAVTNGSSNGEKAAADSQASLTYRGHGREEVTRLLIQTLSDMGFQTAAETVSRQSGFDLESPTVAAFRSAVLSGSWAEAEQLLFGAAPPDAARELGNGLVLAPGADRDIMRFWLRQQKYLELLEQRDTTRALAVLRGELTPLNRDVQQLHTLASLIMCPSADDLKARAEWDGANGTSRKLLLSELSKCISPSVMLPEHRLAVLLDQVKQSQIDSCLYHTAASSPSLYSDHMCDRQDFPSEVAIELTDLPDEVWEIKFSHDGTKLAGCGSENQVVVWETTNFSVLHTLDDAEGRVSSDALGVGNIAWSPDDSMLVTCCQDKHARVWNMNDGSLLRRLKQFDQPVTSCVWSQDSHSFVLGSLDRNRGICSVSLLDGEDDFHNWGQKHRVQALCGSIDGRWIVALDDTQAIQVYNGMTREFEYNLDLKLRPTSIVISQDSRHLLVKRNEGEAQLIDLFTKETVQKYTGHTGGEFLIRGTLGGANESFVTSGSEDGNIFIWHKNSGIIVERLYGHHPRCNSAAFSPSDPGLLVSCGDDKRIKVWTSKGRSNELRSRRPGVISWGALELDG